MFGGICFMLNGNMCAGALNDDLIVRVAAADYAAALTRPHARAFDFTGRPMKGFVVVRPEGCNTAKRLEGWLALGIRVAQTGKPTGRKSRALPRRSAMR